MILDRSADHHQDWSTWTHQRSDIQTFKFQIQESMAVAQLVVQTSGRNNTRMPGLEPPSLEDVL
jgi:hypothetical protein